MIILILRLAISIIVAVFAGKLVSKIKLPAILGWLIAGMLVGPFALSIMNSAILESGWYLSLIRILECAFGLLIGTELVWRKIEKTGKQIVVTTITQSFGTFLFVTLGFGVVFYYAYIPFYIAVIFGAIAMATAPIPALSIAREFKADGPITRTLIPMAALDNIFAIAVFFTSISVISARLSNLEAPVYMTALVVLLPLIIGFSAGILAGVLLKKERNNGTTIIILGAAFLLSYAVGFVFNNYVLPKPLLNFMLIGMAFSAAFSNMISEERLKFIVQSINPLLEFAVIVVIMNLGVPLDYHLITGAGVYTAIYIISRTGGKYFGALFGASITKSPDTVKKYLGLTLLPHSGVSLVFTGIAAAALSTPVPEYAQVIKGTIAAAAIINEIIAVVVARKTYIMAGEFNKAEPIGAINDAV